MPALLNEGAGTLMLLLVLVDDTAFNSMGHTVNMVTPAPVDLCAFLVRGAAAVEGQHLGSDVVGRGWGGRCQWTLPLRLPSSTGTVTPLFAGI